MLLASLVLLQNPKPIEVKFSIQGAVLGENKYEEKADGSFHSVSHLKLGATDIVNDLTGQWKDGTPTNLVMKQTTGPNSATVTIKDGKYIVDSGKTHKESPFSYKGKLFFTNFHPQLMRVLPDVYRGDLGGKQTLPVFMLDGGVAMDVPIEPVAPHIGKQNGQPLTAAGFDLDLKSVKVDYYSIGDKRVVGMEAKSQQFQGLDAEVSDFFTDPLAAYPELSQPTFGVKAVTGVVTLMRDGVKLVSDMLIPDAPGKYPVILERTPYGRQDALVAGTQYAKRGYVVVVQDCRGREGSDGVWDPMVNERKDGFDTVNWIAKQPWCDGNVGMIGASYGGYVQWAAAVEHPQALKCIIPQVSPPDAFYNIPYEFGTVPMLSDLWWLNVVRNKHTDLSGLGSLAPNPGGLSTLPVSKAPKATFGYDLPMFTTWLKRDRAADWKGYDIEKDVPSVKIPVLHISGWWDGDGIGTELHWNELAAAHKENQWLIEGPWTHAFNTTTEMGEYKFGDGAILELDSVYLRFFDTYLKGKSVSWEKRPKAMVFMTGENAWHQTAEFPEAGTKLVGFNLSGENQLTEEPGVGVSKYTYDPKVGVIPSLPKPFSTSGSLFLNSAEKLPGRLLFKTAPFTQPTSFEGPVSFMASFKSDVVDTDLYALIVDIQPDGKPLIMSPAGKLRLAYRNGFSKPELMKPGTIYKVRVLPWWFAHRFEKGHRLGLIVVSSLFPGTVRNPNTGESPLTATKMIPAHVQILHDKAHPSTLYWYRLGG